MVKGINRQVIVVQSPDPSLFEQAIFILKDDPHTRKGITDEALMKEANRLITSPGTKKRKGIFCSGPAWAAAGAAVTAAVWAMSAFF